MKDKNCSTCRYKGPLKGHGMCPICYNKALYKFQYKKSRGQTEFRNLREYIAQTSTFISKELSPNRKKAKDLKINLLIKLIHNYVKDLYEVNGKVRCYTSDLWIDRKAIHCGHFADAGNHKATRFDWEFLRPQSYYDNVVLSGNKEIFEKKLRNDLGNEVVDEFIYRSHQDITWTDEKLNEKLKQIKLLIKNFKNE